MEKKVYQQPKTVSTMMEPRTILCASAGGGFIAPGGGGENFGGE